MPAASTAVKATDCSAGRKRNNTLCHLKEASQSRERTAAEAKLSDSKPPDKRGTPAVSITAGDCSCPDQTADRCSRVPAGFSRLCCLFNGQNFLVRSLKVILWNDLHFSFLSYN